MAYILWGFLPVYFKLVESVSPTEILAHRIVWAVPFGAIIIHLRKQWPEVREALAHPTVRLWLTAAAILIAINWYVYIYAVQVGQIFQGSLAYYITPLVFVVFGVILFDEKLRPLQLAAVVLAAIGVLVLASSGGEFPWMALVLAASFSTYGVIRKKIVIGAMPGLFIETLILAPFALAWLVWMMWTGEAAFGRTGLRMDVLLILAGPLTVVPLLMFAVAARRLSLTALAFIQFLAPTLQFLTAIYYGEPLTTPKIVCFVCIWGAVIFFCTDAIKESRRRVNTPAA